MKRMMSLLQGAGDRHSIDWVFDPLQAMPVGTQASSYSAFLLGHAVNGAAALRSLRRPLWVSAPWGSPGTGGVGTLIWPYDESSTLWGGPSERPDSWIETSHLSRAALEVAAAGARATCLARRAPGVAFITSGYGEVEDFAWSVLQDSFSGDRSLQVLPIQDAFRLALHSSRQEPAPVFFCVGRAAVPLGRLLGIQGWVACVGQGEPLVAQAWGEAGPSWVSSLLLERMGLVIEARELEDRST